MGYIKEWVITAKKQTKKRFQILKISFLIGVVVFIFVFLLEWSGLFNKLEKILYDWRMVKRPKVTMSEDIVTIDIDENSITNLGRWPWNWNIHSYMTDMCNLYNIKMCGFIDISFEKEGDISYNSNDAAVKTNQGIKNSLNQVQDLNQIFNRVNDPNQLFYNSIKKYKNIFVCNNFHILEEDIDYEEALNLSKNYSIRHSIVKKERIKGLDKFVIQNEPVKSFRSAIEITPSVKEVSNLTAGVGFNRLFLDNDGTLRRYLLVVNYDEKVYPSVALLMAAKYFGCPYRKIKIYPGEYVELTEFDRIKFSFEDTIKIPIDESGFMLVNWVGTYGNSFVHYPFEFIGLHYSYFVCKQVLKKFEFQSANPDEVQMSIHEALNESGLLTQEKVEILTGTFLLAFYMEGFISNNYSYPEFLASMGLEDDNSFKSLWDQIYFNNFTVNSLTTDSNITYNEIIKSTNTPDTDIYKHCFEHVKFFFDKKKVKEVRPLLFTEQSKIYIKNKYVKTSLLSLRNKIVFIGLTATGLNSFNPSPYQDRYVMHGLTPNVVNTIITQEYITSIKTYIQYLILLAYALFTAFIILKLNPKIYNILFLLLLFGHPITAWQLFIKKNIVINMISPVVVQLITYFSAVMYKYFEEQKERKRVRGMFSTMVSPEVLKLIESNPKMAGLAGEKKEATLFSSDVSGFTTISEGVTAQELAEILNVYLTPMSNIIMSYGGYCDKYEGDAIKADFGVPLPDDQHPWKACYATLLQQEEIAVIQRMILVKYGVEISARMGVNTGIISAGNMGSERKMQYTVMGEAVTLAEELEPINKLFESWIAIGPTTYEKSGDKIETRLLNYLIMDEEIIPAYELMGWNKEFYLEYWLGKSIPALILEGLEKMPPEKIFGYYHYYTTKKLPDSPMLNYMKEFYGGIVDKCVEYFKNNDTLSVNETRKNLKILEDNMSKYMDKVSKDKLDKTTIEEYEELKKISDESSGWKKVIFLWKSKVKYLLAYQQELQDIIERNMSEKFLNDIDVLDKKIECLNKRISFPEENDKIGKDLSDNLIQLVTKEKESANLSEIETKLKNITAELNIKKTNFVNYLKDNSDDYHRLIAEYCTMTDTQKKVRELYNQAKKEYLNKNWDKAISIYREALKILPTDGPSNMYIAKIEEYKNSPPPESWQGEWVGEV